MTTAKAPTQLERIKKLERAHVTITKHLNDLVVRVGTLEQDLSDLGNRFDGVVKHDIPTVVADVAAEHTSISALTRRTKTLEVHSRLTDLRATSEPEMIDETTAFIGNVNALLAKPPAKADVAALHVILGQAEHHRDNLHDPAEISQHEQLIQEWTDGLLKAIGVVP